MWNTNVKKLDEKFIDLVKTNQQTLTQKSNCEAPTLVSEEAIRRS
jgi:hypothetical protein